MTNKKKVSVILEDIKEEQKTLWQKIKDFFYHSHNVAYNVITGAFSSVMTVFALIDWTPFIQMVQAGTGLNRNQIFWIFLSMLGVAIGGYITRVIGTKEVNGHLLPKAD